MAGAYSGASMRAAHFASRPPVPGVNADHTNPDPEPDPFNPVPDKVPNQTGTVWTQPDVTAGQSNQPNYAQTPVSHWWQGRPPVPTNVEWALADQEFQNRFIENHSFANVIPDSIRLYVHQGQGKSIRYEPGRLPREAGISVPENAEFLIVGKNGYDRTNQPNEVYTGDSANVGRYRVGMRQAYFGLYSMPIAKNGQDAQLRAYPALAPAFPVDKPQLQNTAPYTPNSQGTAHWGPAVSWQTPSLFGVPSETSLTDYARAEAVTGTDFVDRGEFF